MQREEIAYGKIRPRRKSPREERKVSAKKKSLFRNWMVPSEIRIPVSTKGFFNFKEKK
jgi:hypothetical protein